MVHCVDYYEIGNNQREWRCLIGNEALIATVISINCKYLVLSAKHFMLLSKWLSNLSFEQPIWTAYIQLYTLKQMLSCVNTEYLT